MKSVFFLAEQERLLATPYLEGLAGEGYEPARWEGEGSGLLLARLESMEDLELVRARVLEKGGGIPLVWILPGREPHLWARAAQIGGEAFVSSESGLPGLLEGIRFSRIAGAERAFRLLPLEEAWFPLSSPVQGGKGLAAAIRKVFHFQGNVGIQGEEGTGQFLLSRALHCMRRHQGPFLLLDCSSLGDKEVLDLFLGRSSAERGLLDRLRGGTLVLRNPQDLSHPAQAALYAWLHRERERDGAGGGGMVQVISICPVSLASLALEGEFNRALALILEERDLALPPLRERRSEIPAMAAAWCASPQYRCSLSLSAARALQGHQWPRNALELQEVLEEGAAKAGREGTILPMHLPSAFRGAEEGQDREELYLLPRLEPSGGLPKLKEFREKARLQAERIYLLRALEMAEGKVSGARRIAGFSKSTFYALLQKHGLLPPRKKERT